MRRVLSLAVAIVALSACGSSTPTTPLAPTPPVTPPAAPPAPTTIAIAGRVTATNGGQPLAGLSVAMGTGGPATTDGIGAFTMSMQTSGNYIARITGSTIVPRTLTVAVTGPRDVAVNAIALGGGFDQTFYRTLVRNGFEAPSTLEPLRRWTRTPQIYLKTVDEAGEAIHGPTLDLVEGVVKEAVPLWTGGALGVPVVERGSASREGVSGWLTIKWPAIATPTRCGTAQVGVDGGWIEFEYHNGPGCRCPTAVMSPTTIRHEVGHALGFWHTDNAADVMSGRTWTNCDLRPSARERYHAAIAYQRPVGNTDPDTDPSGAVTLAPLRAIP
jgi:hypothetical protein